MNIEELQTKDGFRLSGLVGTQPIFEITRDEDGRFRAKERILIQLRNQLKIIDEDVQGRKNRKSAVQEIMDKTFYLRSNVDSEIFKLNKLSYTPRVEDFKTNYKNALKIISNFTDKELWDFVQQNKSKI